MDKLLVVKLGGKVLEDEELLHDFVAYFAAYPQPKILIHGGGKQASSLAQQMGVIPQMIDGRRVTDGPMLDIALMTYAGLLNKKLVAQINAKEEKAVGLCGADANLITANKRPVGEIDYGYVGDIQSVQAENFQSLLQAGLTPVICALTHDGQGQILNTNADSIANAIAQAMQPFYEVELWLCMDLPGVLLDINDPDSILTEISEETYENLKNDGVVHKGMLPKLEAAFDSLSKGVQTIYISNTTALLHPQHKKTQITSTT